MLRKLGFGSQDEQLSEIRTRRQSEKEEDQRDWDRKKILIAFIVLVFLAFAAFSQKDSLLPVEDIDVKGVSESVREQNPEVSNATQRARDRIDEIKEDVNNLNIVDVATSSPQIQKVINDIKVLENLPRDQAKSACEKICSGL